MGRSLGLKNNTAAPLTRYVEIAHGQRDNDRADGKAAQDEAEMRVVDQVEVVVALCELPGKLTEQQTQVSADAITDYNESATNIILSKLTEAHRTGAGAMEVSIADIRKFIGIIAGSL